MQSVFHSHGVDPDEDHCDLYDHCDLCHEQGDEQGNEQGNEPGDD